jgi:hypothetical protein
MRAEFPQSVKISLAHCAGNRCSNPNCRVPTSGPAETIGKFINLGVACHISAAAPNGPRFDPILEDWARTRYDNGIWLCQKCAKLIDSDIIQFTPDLLVSWRLGAEEEAKSYLLGSRFAPHGNPKELSFAQIRLTPGLEGWRSSLEDNYPDILPSTQLKFNRFKFAEIDPVFDISLANNTDYPKVITHVGINLKSTMFLAIGFGGPEAFELKVNATYSVDVGTFEEEIHQLVAARKSTNNFRVPLSHGSANIPEKYRHSIDSFVTDINISHDRELADPLLIQPKSAARFTLLLKNYEIYHYGVIQIQVKAENSVYSSENILMDMLPGDR